MSNNSNTHYSFLFPTSPNWYLSKVSDIDQTNNFFAFGAKNGIHILDIQERKFVGQLIGHKDRVTAISFCKNAELSNILISGSSDKSVVQWSITNKTLISMHSSIHRSEVLALSTSTKLPDLVISGDKDGLIVVWRMGSSELQKKLQPVSVSIFSIECTPYNEDLVTIGYQNGLVMILNTKSGDVVHRLTGHVDEVQCCRWNPFNNLGYYYLATSSKDKTIRIWELTENGDFSQVYRVLTLPKASNIVTDQQKVRTWLTLDWINNEKELCLISSSHGGDLLYWQLSSQQPIFKKFTTVHSRSIFNVHTMISPQKTQSSSSSSKNATNLAISISMDRLIVLWDTITMKPIWRIPGLGGFVYALDSSVNDPRKIGVACGDKTIRVWNPDSKKDPYESVLVWKGIQAKVTMIAFHPKEIGIVAYGLEDGRVGITEIHSQKLTSFQGGHRDTVYELQWRVVRNLDSNNNEDKNNNNSSQSSNQSNKKYENNGEKVLLYSCGDGIILEWDPSNPSAQGKNISHYIAEKKYKLWNTNTRNFEKEKSPTN